MAREYSGKDCKIAMLGREVAAISISYSGKQEKTNMFVLGKSTPYAEIVGRKEFEGEIVLPQSEFEAIVRSLPAGQDPLDIAPFDIVVLYIDEVTRLAVTDILEDCTFTEYGKEMKNEDDMMEVSLPLRISNIKLNVRND
ncbi:MAG: hypothetical protein Fur0027_14580 [Raineya sp.]